MGRRSQEEMMMDSETRKLAAAMNREDLELSNPQRTTDSRHATVQSNVNDYTS